MKPLTRISTYEDEISEIYGSGGQYPEVEQILRMIMIPEHLGLRKRYGINESKDPVVPPLELENYTLELLNKNNIMTAPKTGDMLTLKPGFDKSVYPEIFCTVINTFELYRMDYCPPTLKEMNGAMFLGCGTVAWELSMKAYVVPFYRLYMTNGTVANIHPIDFFENFDVVSGTKQRVAHA